MNAANKSFRPNGLAAHFLKLSGWRYRLKLWFILPALAIV
jgi:hypothetical protein